MAAAVRWIENMGVEVATVTAIFELSGTVTAVTPGRYSKPCTCSETQQRSACDLYMNLDPPGPFRTSPRLTTSNWAAASYSKSVDDHQDDVPAILYNAASCPALLPKKSYERGSVQAWDLIEQPGWR